MDKSAAAVVVIENKGSTIIDVAVEGKTAPLTYTEIGPGGVFHTNVAQLSKLLIISPESSATFTTRDDAAKSAAIAKSVAALCAACSEGDLPAVSASLVGLSADNIRRDCCAPLLAACATGHLISAQWVFRRGGLAAADLRVGRDEPLRLACLGGHTEVARWLVREGLVGVFGVLRIKAGFEADRADGLGADRAAVGLETSDTILSEFVLP